VYKELTGGGHAIRLWSDCTCWGGAVERAASFSTASAAADAGRQAEPEVSDARPIQRFNLASFDPAQLANGEKLRRAADWAYQDCGMQCRRLGEPLDTHRRTMSVHHVGA
jgi:hypothetical protein